MRLKQAQRAAAVAWGPTPQTSSLLASGTVAGSVDGSFSCTGTFEILDVGLSDSAAEVTPLGTAESAEKFYSVAWGSLGADGAHPWGVVAGGLADGSVNLWDAHAVANGNASTLSATKQHDGPVFSLEWNHTLPNLLASGAGDGATYIWDFTSPSAPAVFSPGPNKASAVGDITSVAWNRKVEYVLASVSAAGPCVVWDLKQKRSVVSFGDPTRRMVPSSVSWSPIDQMTLVVASSSDDYPVCQVWDLRNARSPLLELKGHTAGIMSTSWCQSDEAMLLTSSKDRNCKCWNPSTGEYLCTVATAEQDIYDVQWSPKNPALFSCCSFDSQVAVHMMSGQVAADQDNAGGISDLGVGDAGQPAPGVPPPKWLQRPCGASFGFGGRLVHFNGSSQTRRSRCSLSTVVDDDVLYSRFTKLQQAIQNNQLPAYCEQRAADESSTVEEADAWSFLKALLDQDPRGQLLSHLKLDAAHIPALAAPADEAAVEAEVPAPPVAEQDPLDQAFEESCTVDEPTEDDSAGAEGLFGAGESAFGAGESTFGAGESAFGAALEQETSEFSTAVDTAAAPAAAGPDANFDQAQQPCAEQAAVADESFAVDPNRVLTLPAVAMLQGNDEIVTRALIAAQPEIAVEACFATGNHADALVIASLSGAGSVLFNKTIRRYLEQQQHKPFSSIASAVVDRDYDAIIRGSTADSWMEVLALLCTYVPDENQQFTTLCNALATHMENLGLITAAVSCYMCCGNVDKVVQFWTQTIEGEDSGEALRVQSFVERTIVFLKARAVAGQAAAPAQASQYFSQYAQMLVSVGQLDEAMKNFIPSNSPVEMELHHRIYQALPQTSQAQFSQPAYPFDVNQTLDALVAATAQAQAAAQAAQQQEQYEQQMAAQQAQYAAQQAQLAQQQADQQAAIQAQQAAQQQQYQQQQQQYQQQPVAPQQPGQYQQQPGQYQQQPVAPQQPQWGTAAPAAQPVAPVAPSGANQWGTAAPVAPSGANQWGTAAPAAQPVAPVAPSGANQWGTAAPVAPVAPSGANQWGTAAPVAPVAPSGANQWGTAAPVAPSGANQWGTAAPAAPNEPANVAAPAGAGNISRPPTAQPKAWTPNAAQPNAQPIAQQQAAPVEQVAAPAPVDQELLQMGNFVKMTMQTLLQRCQANSTNPGDKRKFDDINSKLAKLFGALDQGSVSRAVVTKMKHVCDTSNTGDFAAAGKLLASMTKEHFGEINAWGPSVSRLMKLAR